MKKFLEKPWLATLFILVVLVGGLNAIGVHFIVLELPPFWGATLRFVPAAVLLFLLAGILKVPFPRGRALAGAILFGALNFGGGYAFIYYGLQKVQPGMSQVILALVPLFTYFFAFAHRQEAFSLRGLLGALLALAGILVVFWEEIHTNIPPASLFSMILGAACIAESTVIVKFFPKSHPIQTNAIGMLAGSIILFLISILRNEKFTLPIKASTWAALIFLILLGSCVLFLMVLTLLKQWSASTVSYVFVLYPFVSLTASAWLANEVINPILLVGAVFVLTGAVIGILAPPKQRLVLPELAASPVTVRPDGRGEDESATYHTRQR